MHRMAELPENKGDTPEGVKMKKQVKLIVASAGVLTLGMIGQAMAFHDGGVGQCENCHTMHNSLSGAKMMAHFSHSAQPGGGALLIASDQSSTCLGCHGSSSGLVSFNVKTSGAYAGKIPANKTPGGDFSWTMIDCAGDATRNSKRGHNIVAGDFNMLGDSRLTLAPGGTFPSAKLQCSSCHDPHGKYRVDSAGIISTTGNPISGSGSYGATASNDTVVGAYRLLAGAGYQPVSLIRAGITDNIFTKDSPAAVSPTVYNSSTPGGVRVAYGSGMSEWCANCHGAFHAEEGEISGAFSTHPAGNSYKLGVAIAANYNGYVKSGDMTGTQANSNLNLVPVEAGLGQSTAERAAMIALIGSTTGPDATANIMCLTCHRAHASGHESMLRWNQNSTFVTDAAGAYSVEDGLLPAQVAAAYYGKPASNFGPNQRSLCNKCHAKD